jgi:Zn-dependent protease
VLFASLILHELGHALVARRQGIHVERIELFLFGGLTQMSRDAASPGEDFKIAAAGPLATLLFCVLCLGLDLVIVGPSRLLHAAEFDTAIRITPVLLALSWLFLWNLLLLVFNLVPAFPLDGGRIARSIIWRVTGDKRRGTEIAAKLGQAFAVLLGAAGVYLLLAFGSFLGLWLILTSFLLGQSARGAVAQTAFSARIEGVRVADIMDPEPVAIPEQTPVTQAQHEFFLRYGWDWFPVVDAQGHFVGIARSERVQEAVDRGEGWLTVGSVMAAEDAGKLRVGEDRPLTDVLSSESLGRLGAMVAVDGDGVLRGVVTLGQVRRALQTAFGSPAA